MKLLILVLDCIILSKYSYSNSKFYNDTVGIYISKQDYLNDHLTYESNALPKSRAFLFYSNIRPDIDYTVFGSSIKFRNERNHWTEFKSGSVFGFYIRGRIFIYNKSIKKYVQVIHLSPFYFYPETSTANLQDYRVLYFAKNMNDKPVLFNKKNIRKLESNPSSIKVLLNLYHSLTGLFGYYSVPWMSYKKYIDTIQHYISQYNNSSERENHISTTTILSLIQPQDSKTRHPTIMGGRSIVADDKLFFHYFSHPRNGLINSGVPFIPYFPHS